MESTPVTMEEYARRLLARIGVLRQPSDLDLLIFFIRHPRSLLPSEHLTTFLGYGTREIAASLDLLVEAGLVTRTPNPRHPARMYVFAADGPGNGWLPDLTRMALTREGRLAMVWALKSLHGSAGDSVSLATTRVSDAKPRTTPFLVGPKRDAARPRKIG